MNPVYLCILLLTIPRFISGKTDVDKKLIELEGRIKKLERTVSGRPIDECSRSNGYVYSKSTNLCYKFENTVRESWPSAKKHCMSEGADLIVLDTKEKYYMIVKAIRADSVLASREYFIGATDELAEGKFLWVNGKELSLTDPMWAPKQPNNLGGNQDYVIISTQKQGIDDEYKQKKHYFICEK